MSMRMRAYAEQVFLKGGYVVKLAATERQCYCFIAEQS